MNSRSDYFIVESSSIALASISNESIEEIIEGETGIAVNARLGKSEVQVFIPAEILDFLISFWKTIDGQTLSEMITE